MSLAVSYGFIMWPRCVRTFFPFLQTSLFLTGVWLRQGSYFANTRRQPLAGHCSLEQTACQGKSNRVPPEPSAPRWVEISCRLMQEDKGARKELGRKMKGGARMKEGHTLMRLITGASTAKVPNNGPSVCTCAISSPIRRFWPPLPAHAPLLLPLLFLFLRFLLVFALGGLCPDERQSR